MKDMQGLQVQPGQRYFTDSHPTQSTQSFTTPAGEEDALLLVEGK